MASRKVEFSAKIDKDLAERFKRLYPYNGATTWFISTALEAFLDQTEGQPTLQDHVQMAVNTMLVENRRFAQFLRDMKRTA